MGAGCQSTRADDTRRLSYPSSIYIGKNKGSKTQLASLLHALRHGWLWLVVYFCGVFYHFNGLLC